MARLHEHLKYFVNKKISTDKSWQGVTIYFSGHEVIIVFIYLKSFKILISNAYHITQILKTLYLDSWRRRT